MIGRLSTSSFEIGESRIWRAAWIRGLVLALLLMIVGEGLWRSSGHAPNVTDSENLWSYHRSRVYGSNVLVLLGASRAQLGIDHDLIQEQLPNVRFVNLAINGLHPNAVLRDLAFDRNFRGKVIVDIGEAAFERRAMDQSGGYPYYYHRVFKRSLALWSETGISAKIQEYAVSHQANLRPLRILQSLWNDRSAPQPYYIRTNADRMITADYRMAPQAFELRTALIREELEAGKRLQNEEFEAVANDFRDWVSRLKGRGADIAFVRFPTIGIQRQRDEQFAPRPRFWDRIALHTGALTLHSDDFASKFDLPDTSHLDGRDKRQFTMELLQALRAANFL